MDRYDEASLIDPSSQALARKAGALAEEGQDLYEKGNFSVALADFDQALKLEPGMATAEQGRQRALAALQPKEMPEERPKEKVPRINKTEDYRTFLSQGWELMKNRSYEKALEAFDRSIGILEGSEGWAGKGMALLALNQADASLGAFDRALALNQSSKEAWAGKAAILLSKGQTKMARLCFDSALRLDPSDAELWFAQAQVQLTLKDNESALASLTKAAELEPENVTVLQARSDLLLDAGKYREAAEGL